VLNVIRSSLAEEDLLEIWQATFRQWGREQADAYLIAISAAIERLAEFPQAGASCDWVRTGFRRIVVRHHLVFYKASDSEVRIIRVLHERMNIDGILN
jgi:toxin ParE1/3/4